ncbi:recombinase family protein [Allofournierella sp.]|uniref:recombinase family protein n=1 Tax=Allofournierella sp. TaxID=1940256 RepID=UPI003AEFF681
MNTSAAKVEKPGPADEAVRAVIYARYSCSAQNEQSIEGQLKDCRAFAERCGFLVVGEYIDRALTGRSDDRPNFQRMIDDAKKGQFQRVIVWKLDRFSRNRYDSALYKYKLKQNGVIVCSAMENIGEGDESIILEAVLEATAEYYSKDLSKKVLRGMRDAATAGHSTGGTTGYGWKLVADPETAANKNPSRKPVPDGERAEFVSWAFKAYAYGGVRDIDIYAEMCRRGLDYKDGKRCSYRIIGSILRNPKYKGAGKWGDISVEWPALTDEATWEAAQVRRNRNKHRPAEFKAKVRYDLSGKLFCGYCGEPLVGCSGTSRHGSVSRYYSCRGRKIKRTGCQKAHEKKDFIEWYVVEQTLIHVLAEDRLKFIAEKVVEKYDQEFSGSELAGLEKRLAAINRDLDKTTELLFAAPSRAAIDRINEHVSRLEAQRDELEIEHSKLKIAASIRYTVPEVMAWLRQFCGGDACDPEFRRRIIDVFVNSVYLYDDKVVIYYNQSDHGPQVCVIEPISDADAMSAAGAEGKGSYLISNGSPHSPQAAVFPRLQLRLEPFSFVFICFTPYPCVKEPVFSVFAP